MTLIYYDNTFPKHQLANLRPMLSEKLGSDILFVPKDLTILQNATKEQLMVVKEAIELALLSQEDN